MAGFDWYADSPKPCSKLCNLSNLQLRFLCPSDIQEVQALCSDWFPIVYPQYWYEEITSNPRFYSLAAVCDGVIIGLIVAEIKAFSKLNDEDEDILAPTFGKDTLVAYLLSLGVSQSHRRNGIASVLLDNLISHLTSNELSSDHWSQCKALFLHVLTTNSPAIHFYQRHQFKLHAFLPYYYYINGKSKDGFTYVLYVNGGHPPWEVPEPVVPPSSPDLPKEVDIRGIFGRLSLEKNSIEPYTHAKEHNYLHYYVRQNLTNLLHDDDK
ncbi:N-alpha-acetyltransferase 60 [Frankliniella fusca]|uniref:N-alpha-acetyltransferase 60 n=1 Tax=Frankliniella fusca TaxID=407009 RepID=A0AAE1H1D0_9NEOP|nr:N-alpha-acetyltransferase 60 [Frankliniella fusca]